MTIGAVGEAGTAVSAESMTTVPLGSGILKGVGTLATFSSDGAAVTTIVGRWALSGLNLLAGGGLSGQEMNQDVVTFLNDLSSVLAANGGLDKGRRMSTLRRRGRMIRAKPT